MSPGVRGCKSIAIESNALRIRWQGFLQIYHVETGLKRCLPHPVIEGQYV
jgi:hypothetical protein